MGWNWLENPTPAPRWGMFIRIVIKALILFALCNLIYAALNPLEALGKLTLYGSVYPARERLTRSNQPQETYSVTTFNLPSMFASHAVSRPKATDEYRVFLIGDSSVWGSGLDNDETYSALINAANLTTSDGRRVVAYNLGYHAQSVLKDLLVMEYALQYQPDAIVWMTTLQAAYRGNQYIQPIIQNNPERVRRIIETYALDLPLDDAIFAEPALLDRTIIGQRRALADLLRLQTYGPAWGATGIDDQIHGREDLDDFTDAENWEIYESPFDLTDREVMIDAFAAGHAMADDVRMLIVNEPIYISHEQTARFRYNTLYPRWAYDSYRELLMQETDARAWEYLDLWNLIDRGEFTDSPVHITPQAAREVATALIKALPSIIE